LYWNPRTFWKNNLWFSLYIKNLQKMNGIVDPNFFCLKCQNLSATWLEIKKTSFSNFNNPQYHMFLKNSNFHFLENFDMKFEVSKPSTWSFKIGLFVEVVSVHLFHPSKITETFNILLSTSFELYSLLVSSSYSSSTRRVNWLRIFS
jgi:hypothetical protein